MLSYFNITGGPTIEGTACNLSTSKHMVADEHDMATGRIEDFPGIEPDKDFILGPAEPDMDHCFIVDPGHTDIPLDTRQGPLQRLVSLFHPKTKIHLETFSTEPAFQFYTGKHVDVPATGDTPAFGKRSGLCIEPSRYVNAVNVPEWRGQVLLRCGQIYGAKTVYKAWKS
jgi:aldose 1-epimerase